MLRQPAPARTAIRVPDSVHAEHEHLHGALQRATTLVGRTGAAAAALATVLHPHFVREEEIALPPLGLLQPLAERRDAGAEFADVLAMTDSLAEELPRMLDEHRAIGDAIDELARAAAMESNAEAAALARQLHFHARTEEEILYPAAILVGEVVRARLGGAG
jgi:hypothetical protein